MKKVIGILLIVCMIFMLGSCVRSEQLQEDRVLDDGQLQDMLQYEQNDNDQEENVQEDEENYDYETVPPQFEGKIAIVASDFGGQRELEAVEALQRKFGDRIVRRFWPLYWDTETKKEILLEIATDPEVEVLIIATVSSWADLAVGAFRDIREDVLIVYIDSWIDEEIIERADLHIVTNQARFASNYVYHAIEMGAETIIHYTTEFHMAAWHPAIMRRDIMKEIAQHKGISFISIEIPDLLESTPERLGFLKDDLPKQMSVHGTHAAFYATISAFQIPLITHAIETGAILPSTSRSSPLDEISAVLGIDGFFWGAPFPTIDMPSYKALINAMREEAVAIEATGRLGSLPMDQRELYTLMAAEYAIRWINGEVDRDYIDLDVLTEIGREIIYRETGEPVGASLERHPDHPNFILAMMDFIVY